jgi:hypothetical protein
MPIPILVFRIGPRLTTMETELKDEVGRSSAWKGYSRIKITVFYPLPGYTTFRVGFSNTTGWAAKASLHLNAGRPGNLIAIIFFHQNNEVY